LVQKPPKDTTKIQTKESSKKGLIVSIDTIKKPANSNKVQELEAMEDALKKATEEAHKQRVALTGGVDMKPKGLM
jgi:biopolymer transport protein ExbD